MIPLRTVRVCMLLLFPAFAAGCAGHDEYADCHVTKLAEVPLVVERNFLFAPVSVNGKSLTMIVDTGTNASLVTPEAAQSLRLDDDPDRSTIFLGAGGTARSPNAMIREIRIGQAAMTNRSVAVHEIDNVKASNQPAGGLLGADFLSSYDVEIDGPGQRMALYTNPGAGPGCADFQPFGAFATRIPMQRADTGQLFVTVAVDGRKLRAMLDTGARATIVTRPAAYDLGVDAVKLSHDPWKPVRGIDPHALDLRLHRFASLDVGPIAMRDVDLTVADMYLPGVQMLLGADWISRHHIWLSYRSGQLFVVHAAAS